MRTGKTMFWVLFMSLIASVAGAQEKSTVPGATLAPGQIVIGENLSPGMPLNNTIVLLGVPDKIKVVRGTSEDRDSIEITYANYGLVVRAMSGGSII